MPRMTFATWSSAAALLAHTTGRAAIPAVTLFLTGIAAALGASRFSRPPHSVPKRALSVALGALAGGCFLLATILPILLH